MRKSLGLAVLIALIALLGGTHRPSRVQAQAASFGDGTYVVGTDIQPGTYRSQGGDGCYWERESGFSGSLADIIANDFVSAPTVVTIAPTDMGFKSDGCGPWSPATSPITTSLTAPFTDGTYVVGLDIAPGTWRAPGGDSCYWQRLSGFGGTTDEILANDFGSGSVVVTIGASDAGFGTSGCGAWSRVQ